MAEEEQATREGYQALEDDLLDTLVGASKQRESATEVIEIPRPDDKTFWFRIRMLDEDEDDRIRKSCQERRSNRRLGGIKTVEDFDVARYRSLCIVAATTQFVRPVDFDDDGKPIKFEEAPNMWESKALRARLDVAGKAQVVDKVLSPGEKDRVVQRIELLSGFDTDYEEQAKN